MRQMLPRLRIARDAVVQSDNTNISFAWAFDEAEYGGENVTYRVGLAPCGEDADNVRLWDVGRATVHTFLLSVPPGPMPPCCWRVVRACSCPHGV